MVPDKILSKTQDKWESKFHMVAQILAFYFFDFSHLCFVQLTIEVSLQELK